MTTPPTLKEKALALQVAIRIDTRDTGTCAAWIDSADRACGKPAAEPWLCARHVKVAQRRAGVKPTVDRADASKADWYAAQIAATRERIDRAETAIRRWKNHPRPDTSDALAAINAPLKQRQRGMNAELALYRAAAAARADLPAARARLAWLNERNPS